MNTEKITRFEVIDHRQKDGEVKGRIVVEYDVKVELSVQDEGRTLKVSQRKAKTTTMVSTSS